MTSELEIEAVLERLVQEVTKLLDADAADCYLVDAERGVLRCAAVHGFDASLVGFEFSPALGLSGTALAGAGAVGAEDYGLIAAPVPNAAYDGFARALVAPMVWAGETRGVLGVGIRDVTRSFSEGDVELLVCLACVPRSAQRRELRRTVTPGARAARLLSHRVPAR